MNATQKEFAEAAGIHQSTVSTIEAGQWVSFPTIIYLSGVWSIDLMRFLKR
jgi:transcriptional regulator with XRE-family HTH domain